MYALTVNYSFDTSVPVWIFPTYEEACAELKRQFEEEVRIVTEENEWGEQLSTEHWEDFGWAMLAVDWWDSRDVTTWTVSEVENM